MRTIKNVNRIILVTSLMMLVFLFGCKKNKSNEPETATGTFAFHLHTMVDTSEVDYNTNYIMTGGRQISVSMAQLYISNVQLVKLDGSVYEIPNSQVLKVQEIEEVTIGTVPAGNYSSVRFSVGLNSTVNHKTPGTSNTTLYRPDMWFGSSVQPDGFIFVNFQGMIDTSTAANMPNQMQNFSYKIGTDASLKQVSMPNQNFTVTPNGTGLVHILIDYHKLFKGIQLNNNSNLTIGTAADNATALGILVKNNIPLMFSYEQ